MREKFIFQVNYRLDSVFNSYQFVRYVTVDSIAAVVVVVDDVVVVVVVVDNECVGNEITVGASHRSDGCVEV